MDYARFRDYYDYIIFMNGKVYNIKKNRFIKPFFNDRYYKINLTKNKIQKLFLFHRILGECFLENPHNLREIDHKDINPHNNKITNLRWASRRLQNINQNNRKDNTTGSRGITFHKSRNSYDAFWIVNNKKKTKSFSVNKYENAKQLAIDYRNKMVEKYYKDII
jgi:hypothetical protein